MGANLLTKQGYNELDCTFCDLYPGYAKPDKTKRYFILLKLVAWLLNPKRHIHRKAPGYFFLWCKERDKYFRLASDFEAATEGLMVCNDHYNPTGTTKAYALTEAATGVIMKHLIAEMDTPKPLEDLYGARIDKPKPAIKGKWEHHNIPSMVPINRGAVRNLLTDTIEQRRRIMHGEFSSFSRLHNTPLLKQVEFMDRVIHSCRTVLYHSNYIGYPGMMPNYYIEVTSGRFVGIGLNLQNVPREVRQAALVGFLDHDVVNCHITITEQLGRDLGCNTDTLLWWIRVKADKRERKLLADQFGTDADTLKQCMLALIYGAGLTTWKPNGEALSIERMLHEYATDFINHPEIRDFKRQAMNIRQAVVKDAKKRNDYLFNHLGKKLYLLKEDGKPVEAGTQYAHILQGLESQMLRHAIEVLGNQMIQLSHDGFVTKKPINTAKIIDLYKQSTGLDILLETEPLAYPLAA